MSILGLLLLLGVFCSTFIDDATGLWCYVCDSVTNPECESLRPEEGRYSGRSFDQYCPITDDASGLVTQYKRSYCKKTVEKRRVHNRDVVRRSCDWTMSSNTGEDRCQEHENYGNDVELVCQCFQDRCNSSWRGVGNFNFVILLLLVSHHLMAKF